MSGEHIGFVGVGVMGEPMCRNFVRKHHGPVTAYDLDPAPLERLAADGAAVAPSIAGLAEAAELIFLSLPSGREVRAVCLGDGGLIEHLPAGRTVVDTSTAPPALAREIEGALGRARHRLRRCAGRAYASGRHRRHTQHHGGRR